MKKEYFVIVKHLGICHARYVIIYSIREPLASYLSIISSDDGLLAVSCSQHVLNTGSKVLCHSVVRVFHLSVHDHSQWIEGLSQGLQTEIYLLRLHSKSLHSCRQRISQWMNLADYPCFWHLAESPELSRTESPQPQLSIRSLLELRKISKLNRL